MAISTLELALGTACLLVVGYAVFQRWSVSSVAPLALQSEPKELKKSQELPEPDPLYNFDLENANTRNHIYVNKTLRFPYFQVGSRARLRHALYTGGSWSCFV